MQMLLDFDLDFKKILAHSHCKDITAMNEYSCAEEPLSRTGGSLWRRLFNEYSSLLIPSPSSYPKTISFIPCGAKTQKKEIMPYPRCGFGAGLRCG